VLSKVYSVSPAVFIFLLEIACAHHRQKERADSPTISLI
jgi:hypothetical protein